MNVIAQVTGWVPTKPAAWLDTAYRLHGGWERWAQIDMALTWNVAGNHTDTEVNVYASAANLAADLVSTTQVGAVPHYDIIELKALTSASMKLYDFYKNRLGADINKIHDNLVPPYSTNLANVRRWAIGLVPVAAVKHEFNLNGPAWTDAQTLAYVDNHFPATETPRNPYGVVDLTHTLAANGNASIIVTHYQM